MPGDSARELFANANFTRWLAARFLSSVAVQMQTVAVGWQVYQLTHDPLDLGLVGLSQFLPFVVLVLPAGQLADRRDRGRILSLCYALELVCAALLLAFTLSGLTVVWPVFAVMVLFGVARAFAMPSGQAMLPTLVPHQLFGRAVAVNSSSWQVAVIAGPSIGGVLYLFGPDAVYGSVTVLLAVATLLMAGVRVPDRAVSTEPARWHEVLEGLRFVFRRKPILGAISMDLFAVLFGGATALLPAIAHDVLHVGPAGLGVLRAAPGVGAAVMAGWLAWRPIVHHIGGAMFGGVVVFGIATVTFGLSTSFWLSLVALALLGAGDMVSVYVRHLLVQLWTPDAIRGRVSAVNAVFIGASNELGEFESGVTAAWWGVRPAVVVGGLASVAVAAVWSRLFPELRDMRTLPAPARE
jgi:MFS family permease